MGQQTDSDRAWTLLLHRLDAIDSAEDDRRRENEALDKALAAVAADIAAVKENCAKRCAPVPRWQRWAWSIGTIAGAGIAARLMGLDPDLLNKLLAKLVGG